MQGLITKLPDVLVDQIAAGEVVERPASVVKELVENALDAGATHVTVEIDGGGKSRIRVLDNGMGMSAEQAELALQRHATSKIRRVEDLFDLDTFGFRGEALPSIAAVSKMTLTTRERGNPAAVSAARLVIEGGRIVERQEVGAPAGTCIEVQELLYNVPARQKFLKGEATESSHINDVMVKIALAHPKVHLRLKNRSRCTINAPLHTTAEERVRHVMGSRLGSNMVAHSGEYAGVKVQAFLSSPELAQSTTRGLQFFVGSRGIRDRGILAAVCQGYDELIPRGRYPVAVLFIEVPNPEVDVNVHPQKLEVRFSDPQLVYAAVRQTVRNGVAQAQWSSTGDEEARRGSNLQVYAAHAPPGAAIARHDPFVPARGASRMAARYAKEQQKLMLPWGKVKDRVEEAAHKRSARKEAHEQASPPSSEGPAQTRLGEGSGPVRAPRAAVDAVPLATPAVKSAPARDPEFFGGLRYLGQLDRTYLLCEADGELVLLDQHAAHERVELEKLLVRYRERSMPVQRLLFPQTVELTAAQAEAADRHGDQLAMMGFELDDFGEGNGRLSYALKAVPAGLKTNEPQEVLLTVLDQLVRKGTGSAVDEQIEAMLATVACHSVVRAGDNLGAQEVDALLKQMDAVDFRGKAPHGRPVLLRIPVSEIARRFGR